MIRVGRPKSGIFGPLHAHTLKDNIAELLTDAILTSKIRPGDRLNESQIGRDLKVSRAPIREALQQLQEQGLVLNNPRRGMFVVSLEDEDVQKINSLRVILEAEALRLARAARDMAGLKRLGQILERMDRMEPSPAAQNTQIDLEFHRTIWNMCGNEYLVRILTSLTAPLFAHAILGKTRAEKARMVLDSHRPLFDYVRGASEETAEQAILTHVRLRWKGPDRYSSLAPTHGTDSSEP
jgi:DNA-binding GntR family transcriptional regulator